MINARFNTLLHKKGSRDQITKDKRKAKIQRVEKYTRNNYNLIATNTIQTRVCAESGINLF